MSTSVIFEKWKIFGFAKTKQTDAMDLDKIQLTKDQLRVFCRYVAEKVGMNFSETLGDFMVDWAIDRYGRAELGGKEVIS